MITYCPRCGARHPEWFRGEWVETAQRCADCGITVADPPRLLAPGGHEDEVEYDLAEWEPGERGAATDALLAADIPYRWEADLVLVVPGPTEEEVDRLLDELDVVDELDDADEDDDGVDGGEEAHRGMTELFVAADRLQHDPGDAALAGDALHAAGVVTASPPPYGIERRVWRRIQELASGLSTDLEDGADEETVAADARALREYLRDLV